MDRSSCLHSPLRQQQHCLPVCLPACLRFVCVQVVVAEAAPGYDGHAMASQLSQAKVQTTLIADSAVFAMMARVNKVRYEPRHCGDFEWGAGGGGQGWWYVW